MIISYSHASDDRRLHHVEVFHVFIESTLIELRKFGPDLSCEILSVKSYCNVSIITYRMISSIDRMSKLLIKVW